MPQGDEQATAVTGDHQLIVKHSTDGSGDLSCGGILAVADIPNRGIQNHGIQNFHNGCGAIGLVPGRAVKLTQAGIAAVDVCPAVLAAENGTLGKHCQAVKGGRTGIANDGVCQDPVVEGDINTIVIAVKGHRLHFNIGKQQFRTPNPCAGSRIQQRLGPSG